jgi:hypothetical protein
MKYRFAAVFWSLSALALAQPPSAQAPGPKGPRQPFAVTTTERTPFQPGGLIRVQNSYGYLSVDGWDEPEVQVTVTKSTDRDYEPCLREKADRLFDEVRVTAQLRSEKELTISTALPHRITPISSRLPSGQVILATPVPPNNKRRVTVEYHVLVPRDSNLIVHQDNGYVWISDLTGNLEVHSHTGDLIVLLPEPGAYRIDARTRFGRISSDIAGRSTNPFLAGGHFTSASGAPARRIDLRMGRGSITIKSGAPSGYYTKD